MPSVVSIARPSECAASKWAAKKYFLYSVNSVRKNKKPKNKAVAGRSHLHDLIGMDSYERPIVVYTSVRKPKVLKMGPVKSGGVFTVVPERKKKKFPHHRY